METTNITREQFEELKRKFDEAESDDTPFAVVANDEVGIVGDPDKTEMKKGEYTVKFGFPNTEEWKSKIDPKDIFKETENYIGVERTFKDVFISPRRHSAVLAAFTELYAFFNYIEDDGEVRDLTDDEIPQALMILDSNIDAVFKAVGAILGLDEAVSDCMIPVSASTTLIKMCIDFPEIINETDFF